MIHFLFPSDPLDVRAPDEFFGEQLVALGDAGFSTSVFPESVLAEGKSLKGIPEGSQVVYRGWMLNAGEYERLVSKIEEVGASPFTNLRDYLSTHHLPNWYPLIEDLTPETRVYPADADLADELRALGWDAFFVKDYVKSLKTSVGSIIHDPSQIETVVAEMEKYRGEIEGGICIRRVEDFIEETERRCFVINGRPFAPEASGEIPEIVCICAERIPSKFFSVDMIQRQDGVLRVVEVGDGQVSDLVGWTAERFAEMWFESERSD